MSPSQSHDDQSTRREINGARPSPLKINKDSHLIQKTTSSSSSSSSSSSTTSSLITTVTATASTTVSKQQRHPVIIYTHSPKIIHTQARDFMALVQKLTGLAPSDEPAPPVHQAPAAEGGNPPPPPPPPPAPEGNNDTTSSSAITEEKVVGGDGQVSSTSASPVFDPPNPFFSDVPLFTPNSSEFFCSPRPFYRHPDSLLGSQYGELDLAYHPWSGKI